MEAKRSILQIYATIVSIVALITFLIAAGSIISALIDRQNPFYVGRSEFNLSSFEQYKMEAMRGVNKDQAYLPTDEEMKAMYEAARDEKIKRVDHQSRRTIIVNSLLLVVVIVLFAIHWRWVKPAS